MKRSELVKLIKEEYKKTLKEDKKVTGKMIDKVRIDIVKGKVQLQLPKAMKGVQLTKWFEDNKEEIDKLKKDN